MVGGWKELARTTLASPNANIDVTGLANKRYYMLLCSLLGAGAPYNGFWRTGNGSFDLGSNYAERRSTNGAADITNVNRAFIPWITGNANVPKFGVSYWSNLSAKEKLVITHGMMRGSSGAGNAPTRDEVVGKWVNTANPLDRIRVTTITANTFNVGSELVVLGWDPADIHTDNFWEELATDTLSTTDSNVQLSITPKKYLWIQAYMKPTATLIPWLRFNNISTGTPYAYRKSDNGESDPAASVSQNQIVIGVSKSTPQFVSIFVVNISAQEKLVICDSVSQEAAGAGTAPGRRETVAKHVLTSGQITEIDLVSSTSSFASGSEFKVWGHD